MEVLHPMKGCGEVEDANAYSQVLLFSYRGHGVLMTGDIGVEQEVALLEKLSDISVLKAAHHGSKYSNSSEFLQTVMPEHIILSYGVGNSYGHPHADAVARMNEINAELWYTGRQGAIMVEVGNAIAVRSWCLPY